MSTKSLQVVVIIMALSLLFMGLSSMYNDNSTHISPPSNISDPPVNVISGNITFTGNVSNNFNGHLIATNTNKSPWGAENNISQLYVSFNNSYLFLGVNALVENNGIIIFLSNNTGSNLGTFNMTKSSAWNRNITFTSPINYFTAVWFSGTNEANTDPSGPNAYLVSSPLSDSNTSTEAVPISNNFDYGPSGIEFSIPWSGLFPYGHIGNLVMSISTFIIGSSGPWVGIGIPYAQEGVYSNGSQSEFIVNNTIQLNFGVVNVNHLTVPVKYGNISFTGNVVNDFQGHLISTNTHASPWGPDNNISQLYVSYNNTYLFLGIKATVDGNGLIIFLENNTGSGFGTFNMMNLNVWSRAIDFTSPMNYFAAVWFPQLNSNQTGESAYLINTPLSSSDTSPYAVPIPNYYVFGGSNDSTEIRIPWSGMFPNGIPEGLTMGISALIIGGSGSWVGTGVPYAQQGTYNDGSQNEFTVNNTIDLTFNLYKVKFTETGLSNDAKWYVDLSNGQSITSSNSSVTFYLPNGSYSYQIGSVGPNFEPIKYKGSFNVQGSGISIPVSFIELYKISFMESGLPTGNYWGVILSNNQTFTTYSNTISFYYPNGSYGYSIFSNNFLYTSSPSYGSFTINGSSYSQTIVFSIATYPVEFMETGLPIGSVWYVNLTNGQSFSQTVTSPTSFISFSELNGSYSYYVSSNDSNYKALHYYGTFNVNGSAISVPVKFYEVTYAVVFFEIGLPSGVSWYVNLTNGQSFSSSSSIIIFSEPNGYYSYNISASGENFLASYSSGSFIINGSVYVKIIAFSPESTSSSVINTMHNSGLGSFAPINLFNDQTLLSTIRNNKSSAINSLCMKNN